MTITPYDGIAVFDVEENAYVFKEQGVYYEGMDVSKAMERLGITSVLRAAAHTVKFLDGEELKEMQELVGEMPLPVAEIGVQAI
ncbi:hypothetical protein C0431_12430 [bacterium]|nr:hypothetical protein [bacterium]